MPMKKVFNWKCWIQVLPSTKIFFSSYFEEEAENLPKLNPGLAQRKDPGGVATTWHSSSTWGIVVFVLLLLLLLLLWCFLLCCYWGLCYHCAAFAVVLTVFVLLFVLLITTCYRGAVCVVVIVVLSLSLFEKVLEKSHRFSLFPQLDSGHRGDPGAGEKNEFLHYYCNPAVIIVNNQMDHQSDNSDNSQ